MITLDLARAHVDELQRAAADYRRMTVRKPGSRRLFARRTRKH